MTTNNETKNQEDQQSMTGRVSITRRAALAAGVAGTAGVALAACSSGSDSSQPATTSSAPTTPTGGTTPSGTVVTEVSEVPKNGATIANTSGDAYVVSQTSDGKVACFSAVCPHEGCLCNRVVDNKAICPCHGSAFDVFTGDVTRGPAQTGLAKVETTVSGGKVIAK
ncbi:MAG: Rieske (2Fe-2S) protein [Candidatus Nanopelagicales bacterium]